MNAGTVREGTEGAGIVIVGAGLGGIRVAERARQSGYTGPVTLIGAENYQPYDRPPLSKEVLRGADRVELKDDDYYRESDLTLRMGVRVASIDTAAHAVVTDSGERIEYQSLVLATGLMPRALPGTEDVAGVHLLRTYDDCVALRDDAKDAKSAIVIGAGFIGCEVAASLHQLGVPSVTIIEPQEAPLAQALGVEVGNLVRRVHVEAGVDIRTGVGVSGVDTADGRASAVRLDDGTVLPADVVVVGIGSVPVTDYLDGSGIEVASRELGGGIACDESGRTSAPDVYAVGDVANWGARAGRNGRVEHWNNTVEQAALIGAELVLPSAEALALPYFWSDQFDLKIQMLGHPAPSDEVHIVSDDGRKFVAYYSRDGLLTGVVGAGKAGAVMKMRAKLQASTPIADLL
ncbi:NAD(P)/FAD-dependent oxidoreductase [Jongsikchunia kroppenstedtii]|uniref:NAD(P)/FAD-dependent oxidoreductase n=1 Tax=Jongsikchunia kroppenstedtii TaxID=1121721 RepID=UPI000686CDD8|nr:FAD/NAD(P)-binding oxidoreductase [Jongsikchunia kroppenstedtii]